MTKLFVALLLLVPATATAATCRLICTCTTPCDTPCTRVGMTPPILTCATFGRCIGHCAADDAPAQTPLEALTHFVAHPQLACVAGDDLSCGL